MSLLTQLKDEGAEKNSWQRSRAWVVGVLGLGVAVALCAVARAISLGPSALQVQGAGVDNLANLVQGRIATGMQQARLRSWLPSAGQHGSQRLEAAPRMSRKWEQLRNVKMSARHPSVREQAKLRAQAAFRAQEALISEPTPRPVGPTAAGPLGVLMLGYTAHEVQQFERMMTDEFSADVPLIIGHEGMKSGTLRTALEMPWKHSRDMTDFIPNRLSGSYRRFIIISGVTPKKVSELIDVYRATDLPRPIFAVAVPHNLDKNLASVVEQLWTEDAAMRRRQRLERLAEPLPSSVGIRQGAPSESPWDSVVANLADFLTVKPRQVATAAQRRPENP